MAELSDVGIPGVGNGILHPKLKNRFRVLFCDNEGKRLGAFGDDVSIQVTSVSDAIQTKVESAYGDHFTINVDDDITGRSSRGVQELFKLDSFMIRIEFLDGNESVSGTRIFKECNITGIRHGDLDYAGGSRPTELQLRTPSLVGNLIEGLSDEAKALLALLSNTSIVFSSEHDWRSGTVEMVLSINFKTLEVI